MSCVESISKCVTQGDSWRMSVTVTETGNVDEAGEPTDAKDLTGATIDFSLKDEITGASIVTPSQTLDLPSGRLTFSLTAAQTEPLITSGQGSRLLTGEPRVTYQDGTVDTLFRLALTIHESYN